MGLESGERCIWWEMGRTGGSWDGSLNNWWNLARRVELKKLQDKKEEIDVLAHTQARRILWSGLGFGVITVGFFFRLTFWEFSWDVMEPIAFFTTTSLAIEHGSCLTPFPLPPLSE